jgi:hypothetical protein
VEGHPVGKTDNGRWSMPAVRALLEKALEQDTPRASLTLSHDDPVVARVRLIAQRSFSEGRTDPVILLVIEPEGFPRQSETP